MRRIQVSPEIKRILRCIRLRKKIHRDTLSAPRPDAVTLTWISDIPMVLPKPELALWQESLDTRHGHWHHGAAIGLSISRSLAGEIASGMNLT
jgi:hypothetical protein